MSELDLSNTQNNIGLLVADFGETGKVAAYQDLANRLSIVAHKESPWSWRYVQSIHHGSVEPSKKFLRAVELMMAEMDGLPVSIAETEPVTVYARPGSVHPNAIVLSESKACANPVCTIHFVPRVPWQKYCPRCRKKKVTGS
jgi:hypothetical protein